MLINSCLWMGGSLSCHSPINKYIFQPPRNDINCFHTYLTTNRSYLFDAYTPSSEKVSAVHVKPVKNPNPEKYLVFAHSNSDDIYLLFPKFLYWADNLDVGVIGFDYVGYGLSDAGCTSEKKCYQSLEAVIDYMWSHFRINEKRIYLVGQSLGAGVVIDYISKNPWHNPVILISPYKTICRIILDSECVAPSYKLKNVTCPVKIIHGDSDELINISHAKKLYRKLPNKSLAPLWIKGAGHNNIMKMIDLDAYREVLNWK